MSVEILIVSGARQGTRLRVDETSFRVGDSPTDTVVFDPEQDTGCRGRRVAFQREENGWRVGNEGDVPVFVNQDELTESRSIRSGDIVRMSPEGPDFSFHFAESDAPMSALEEPPVQRATTPPEAKEEALPLRGLLLLAGSLLAAILLLAAVIWVTYFPADDPLTDQGARSAADPATEVSLSQPEDVPSDTAQILEKPESKTEEAVPDGEHSALPTAIFLLAVEDPVTKTVYPYGSACAISEDALLTSATLAVELEKRRLKGWRVLAASPGEFPQLAKSAREVTGVRIHQAFEMLRATPVEQIFFDLALLEVDRSLDSQVILGVPADLALLERGQPAVCCGIPHAGEQLTRFETPAAVSETVKIFFVMPFPAEGGLDPESAPSLLHIEGALPDNLFGSPVFVNEKVVGIYAERAALPPDMGELNLHYAAMVTLATAWLSGEGRQQWVAPTLAEKPESVSP
jgi:hypothetical protein